MSGAAAEGLVVEGLAKSYRKRPVLRNVSLTLRRGEVAALLGEPSADGGGNAPTPPRRAQMRF